MTGIGNKLTRFHVCAIIFTILNIIKVTEVQTITVGLKKKVLIHALCVALPLESH